MSIVLRKWVITTHLYHTHTQTTLPACTNDLLDTLWWDLILAGFNFRSVVIQAIITIILLAQTHNHA